MKRTALIGLALMLNTAAGLGQTNDGIDTLVRTAVQKQKERPMWFRLRTIGLEDIPFVYEYRARMIKFNGDGSVKNDAFWKQEVLKIDGIPFFTDLESSFAPAVDLKIRDQHKAMNDKNVEKLQRRSDDEKRRAQEARNRRQNERRQFWDEFLRAFRFRTLDHKNLNGRPATTVEFTPDPAYRSDGVVDTKYFLKIQGHVWIDDTDQEIARFEIEFVDDVSAALGLVGKVYKGSRYYMELSKQIDDLWLPSRAETELRQRILFFKEHETFTVEFGGYRKFSTEARIVGIGASSSEVERPVTNELQSLQGTWTVSNAEFQGQPLNSLKGATFVVTDDSFILHAVAGEIKGELRVAPSTSRRTLDLVQQGQARNHVWRGIYVLEGGDLRICYVEDGGEDDRPTKFETATGTSASLIVLKRF